MADAAAEAAAQAALSAPTMEDLSAKAVRNAAQADPAAVLYAQSACGFLHTTAYTEAFRDGGLDALRRAFNVSMAGPCMSLGGTTVCSSDAHREQMCAEWFMRRGPCGNVLAEFATQNPQLCAAARSVAVDYPELRDVGK
jgi:hypothetical protein